jgi:hypothetical protein
MVVMTEPSLAGETWSGLDWTSWCPLENDAIRRATPAVPGVYRIRRKDENVNRLVYVGQTGRTLRERLRSLATGVNGKQCPFNDPHTAAPHLWFLRHQDGVSLECACAPVAGDAQVLHGTEDMLLWRHRMETGLSTEANYGRFYPGYTRPTNRWIGRRRAGTSTPGRRAEPLRAPNEGVDFSNSHPVLCGSGHLLEAPWWQRSPLLAFRSLPATPAVYAIHERGAEHPVYIGETSGLRSRLATHAVAPWPFPEPFIAFLFLPEGSSLLARRSRRNLAFGRSDTDPQP